MWREALNKRPRSGQKDSLKKLKSRAVPQVSRSQSSPCWVCWVGQSGAAWCHAGDAFAGQLEKGSGYIWSQPLTGEHLNAAWFLSPNKKRGTKCFFRLKREFGFFTQKLFAESSLLFLFSACFVIYCFYGSLEAAQSVRRANTLIMQQCFVILKAERITHNILGLHTTLVGSVDSGIIMCFLTFPVWFSVLLT